MIDSNVTLYWLGVTNATRYSIERKADKENVWLKIATTTKEKFVDRSVVETEKYAYRITAENTEKASRPSGPSEVVLVTVSEKRKRASISMGEAEAQKHPAEKDETTEESDKMKVPFGIKAPLEQEKETVKDEKKTAPIEEEVEPTESKLLPGESEKIDQSLAKKVKRKPGDKKDVKAMEEAKGEARAGEDTSESTTASEVKEDTTKQVKKVVKKKTAKDQKKEPLLEEEALEKTESPEVRVAEEKDVAEPGLKKLEKKAKVEDLVLKTASPSLEFARGTTAEVTVSFKKQSRILSMLSTATHRDRKKKERGGGVARKSECLRTGKRK